MKCYICGEGELVASREVIEYDALPGVHLANIAVERCPVCGERFETIPAPSRLVEHLAEQLITKRTRLTPREVRFLRKSMGLSSVDLARKMRVAAATVSRWESGKQAMTAQNDLLLRFLVATERPVQSFGDVYDTAATAEPEELNVTVRHDGDWSLAAAA